MNLTSQRENPGCSSPRKPFWKLAFEAYVALAISVVLGMLLALPLIIPGVRYFTATTYLVSAFPTDDVELSTWGSSLPGVESFFVERKGVGEIWVRSEHAGSAQTPPLEQVATKLKELGYGFRGMRGGGTGLSTGLVELLTGAQTLAVLLMGMQLGFLIVAFLGKYRAGRRGEALPSWFPRSAPGSLLWGVSAGVFLLTLGWLYGFALQSLPGQVPPSPWDAANQMPGSTKAVFLLFGALGAPIAEEVFFRGYLFENFRSAGRTMAGIAVSSILFGAVHFSDLYNVPGICLFGVVLALVYHFTNSLWAPILAHAINNGVMISWMLWGN